jgi:alpha-L-rhamnosidase
MLRSLLFSQVIIILLLSSCSETRSGLTINDLRCENLSDPLGLGTTNPRLSWKMKSDRNGTVQKAYMILVASSNNLLDEENADLWNTGKINSSTSILVPYNGKKLVSGSLCYWKVRVWDENDEISDWSVAGVFSIGLLDKSDWKGSYIGMKNEGALSLSPQLRRSFNAPEKGDKTLLYINSLGYHEVYLNGEKVGDWVLTPSVSQFSKRSQVITYDITSLIKEGMNNIVIWIGRGWYRTGLPGVISNEPLVRAQAEQLNNGIWSTIVYTDSLWTGRNSGYSTIGMWTPGDFGGERIDASLTLTDMSEKSQDEVSWGPVLVSDNPVGEATPQMTEMNKISLTYKADTVKSGGNGIWLADIGKTLTGWVEIRFPALHRGQEVIMEYSDHLDASGNIADQGQVDRYIASGEKDEIFRNKFNYHGFRYIKISNLATQPAKNDITASLIHTDYRLSSSFECSDRDITEIHDMIFYTLRCLSLGGYLVDCPQIERLGYGGDGNASTQTAQTMFDLDPLYNNWLQAWADCIREDGSMPHTAPNPYPAGGGPYWCGFIITASWRTYLNYGDIRPLEQYYPEMQAWLGYVEKHSPSGILQPWPETDYRTWYLGDWASPDGTDQTNKASVTLVNNCFVAVCYETMKRIAGVLGIQSDVEKYALLSEAMKERIHRELYDPARSLYGSGSQIDLTYPLLAGIVPDSLRGEIKKKLHDEINIDNNGHIACGLVGIPVFTEWVIKNREADLMYTMLKKRDYPGYLYMLDNGATTTWEHWNGARSRIHNCYNGIGSWFYQAVGGIRSDETIPGYQHIIIEPQIPEGIVWANSMKETPFGTVKVRWKLEKEALNMNIVIPVGCTAEVVLPQGTTDANVDGESIGSNKHTLDIGSGEYKVVCKLKN